MAAVIGVQSLVTSATQNLQIIQRVIVFAKIYVVRVAWLIRLANLTASASADPCRLLPVPRPPARIRGHSPAVFPCRTQLSWAPTTKAPISILCICQPPKTRSFPFLRTPRLTDFLSHTRKRTASRTDFRNASCADAHCKVPLWRPFIRRLALAAQGAARWLTA